MSAEAEATLRLGLEGEDEVVKGGERIDLTYSRMGERLKSAVGGAVREVGRGFAQLAQDAVRVATAMQGLSLAQTVEQAKALEFAYTRVGIAGKRSMEDVKKEIRETSKYTLTDDATTEQLVRGYGKLTYNLRGARSDIKALAAEGAAGGRSLEEELSLGRTMRQDLGVTGELSTALGKLRAQADQLGVVGGPEALGDMLQRLGPQLQQVSLKSDEARGRLTAFLGELGRGRNADAGARIGSSVLGAIQGNWQAVERTLGRRVRNRTTGQIEDPDKIAVELRDRLVKGRGAERAELALANLFGPEAAAQMMHYDAKRAAAAATTRPSEEVGKLYGEFLSSKAGQRAKGKIERDQSMQDLVALLVELQDQYKALFPNPLVREGVNLAGQGLVTGLTGAAAGAKVAGRMAGKGATGAAAELAGKATTAAALDAEEQAARVAYQLGSRVTQGGLKTGALRAVGGLGLGLASVGGEVLVRGLGSLSKDSELAQNRRAAQSSALGKELAGQAQREGWITPEIYGRAKGDQAAIQEMIRLLSEIRERLPANLAEQIGAATSAGVAGKTLKVAAVGGPNGSQETTAADKASGEGRT